MSRRDADWPPLWHDDPTPGDPEEVAHLGRSLHSTAATIEEQARTIKALSTVDGWDSDAGRAFNEVADGAADRLKKAFERYDEAAKAVGTQVREGESQEFAGEMRRAQRKADKALADHGTAVEEHRQALREIERVERKHPDLLVPADEKDEYERWKKKRDEALHAIGQARKDVSDARDIYDDAGDRAARRIKDVVHHDAVRDPGGFMNFLGDWADRFSNISAVLGVLAVICAFVPPLQFLAPIFATLAVLSSAAALAGHAYDMTVRGGKVDWMKLGTDVLGVMPGLGALKGFRSLSKLKNITKIGMGSFKSVRGLGQAAEKVIPSVGKWGDAAVRGVDGIGHNFLNGVSVTLTNKTLAAGLKLGQKMKIPNLPAQFSRIDGKVITGVVKGFGLGSAIHRVVTGENGERTGYQEPAPKPRILAPGASPQPFHAALAA